MSKHRYEGLLVLNVKGKEDGAQKIIDRIEKDLKAEGCEVATSVGQDNWSFEAKLPMALFQDRPQKGEHWMVNVCRNIRVGGNLCGEAYSSWTPLKT